MPSKVQLAFIDMTTVIGLIAAALTTVSFLPQVSKIIKTRHTKDISLLMYAIFSLGILLWLIYGILLGSLPIILANGVTLILVVFVLILKIRYG